MDVYYIKHVYIDGGKRKTIKFTYQNIPRNMSSDESEYLLSDFAHGGYPERTSNRCWWCCHGFKTSPIAIPKTFADGAFKGIGCFCSFPCALAYKNQNKIETNCSLEYMRSVAYKDDDPKPIVPAPPRECLAAFGGNMTIKAFRESDKTYTIRFAPLMPWRVFCDEVHGYTRRHDMKQIRRPLQIRQAKKT